METQIELCSMLDDRNVQGRKQDMALIVQFRNRDDQQAMVSPRVTVYDGGAGVRSRTICT